jgi:hypothetical protein
MELPRVRCMTWNVARQGLNVNTGGGGTPVTGTVIAGNLIDNEAVDIAANTPAEVDAHLNNLLDESIGIDNLGAGTVNAESELRVARET